MNAKCSLLNGLSCPAIMTQRITLILRAQRGSVTTEVTTVNKHSVRAKLWTQIWLNLDHLDLELPGDPWEPSGWLPPTGEGRRAASNICTPLFFALTERRHRLQELLHWLLPKGTPLWKIPWTEEPGRLQSMGSLRVGHNWATSLSLFTFMHWRRKWQPTPVFLPGESQGRGSLVGCRLWGRTESDTTEAT